MLETIPGFGIFLQDLNKAGSDWALVFATVVLATFTLLLAWIELVKYNATKREQRCEVLTFLLKNAEKLQLYIPAEFIPNLQERLHKEEIAFTHINNLYLFLNDVQDRDTKFLLQQVWQQIDDLNRTGNIPNWEQFHKSAQNLKDRLVAEQIKWRDELTKLRPSTSK